MKNFLRLRILIGITFFVFLLPFFDACTGKSNEGEAEEAKVVNETEIVDSVLIDSIKEEKAIESSYVIENDTIENEKENKGIIIDHFQNKESMIYNAYDLALIFIFDVNILDFNEMKIIALIVLILIINSLIMFVLTFKNKFNTIYKFSIISLVLAIIWFAYLLYLDANINQIKYGFYLYLTNIFIIIYESRRLKNNVEK